MKRILSATAICAVLLVIGFWTLMPTSSAQNNPFVKPNITDVLLALPAPPPVHPDSPRPVAERTADFFDPDKPPPDTAPIKDILDYWGRMNGTGSDLYYGPQPSDHVKNRIRAEIERDPKTIGNFYNLFRGDPSGTRFVRDMYVKLGNEPENAQIANTLKTWLLYNSPYFSEELEQTARQVADQGEYVNNHDELIALARYDWDKASPIISRLYSDRSQPVSRIAALWALYRRANDSGSPSDTDRYRSELIAIVEDKTATNAMRDLAFDALVAEKEWSGMDEWYLSLLADETLADLKVNGRSFTGLTTIINRSPVDRFKDRMIELAASDNKTIRNAAVRNLLVILARDKDEKVVEALLPWLSDPDWAKEIDRSGRGPIVDALAEMKLPDAVPGLISLLNEKGIENNTEDDDLSYPGAYANTAANAVRPASNATVAARRAAAANAANAAAWAVTQHAERYPYRYKAIMALNKQADGRAVAALRSILWQVDDYERTIVIAALLASGGYSVAEQVDALEHNAREQAVAWQRIKVIVDKISAEIGIDLFTVTDPDSIDPAIRDRVMRELSAAVVDNIAGTAMNSARNTAGEQTDLRMAIGQAVSMVQVPGELLVQGLIDRIDALDEKEGLIADALRAVVNRWDTPAVHAMMLRDLKNGRSDADAVLRLLAKRKDIAQTHSSYIADLRSGSAIGRGLSGCFTEDPEAVLESVSKGGEEAATALACSRMIRLPLDVRSVANSLAVNDKKLTLAAERYLTSEDSPLARQIVLSRYPDQGKIMGAKHVFEGDGAGGYITGSVRALFQSVGAHWSYGHQTVTGLYSSDYPVMNEAWSPSDEKLSKEVVEEQGLLGIYSYKNYLVRIFSDKVMFYVQDDDARYKERELSADEFDIIKEHLRFNEVDAMVPYLACPQYERCEKRDLIMVGKAGGRRVFAEGQTLPAFFQEMDQIFNEMALQPMRLRYAASRSVPGLEVLFADDSHRVLSPWSDGGDVRVLVMDEAKLKEARDALVRSYTADSYGYDEDDEYYDEEEEPEEPDPARVEVEKAERAREQHQATYSGYSWYDVKDGSLIPGVAPGGFAFPMPSEPFSIQPSITQWKTKFGATEIRADQSGLYRIAQGKMSLVKEGHYGSPVISANGRWVAVNRYDEESGSSLLRIDMANGREYPVIIQSQEYEGYDRYDALCYIPSVDRFLLGKRRYPDYYDLIKRSEGAVTGAGVEPDASGYMLLDPVTGDVRLAPGEVRPLVQQLMRPLQRAGQDHEFWAALPDRKNDLTVVGIYDSRVFGFKPVITIKGILFNSMQMWVDKPGGHVLFAYKGHLLSVPVDQ